MDQCKKTGAQRIYKHPSVVEIEIAGFKILGTLLQEFTQAVLSPDHHYSGLLLPFIPEQYKVPENAPVHLRIQTVIDFVSGMTDVYALELYRKLQGTGVAGKSLR